jgi:Arc/MetJ-type ribon-helix-helix transcriptional regulator
MRISHGGAVGFEGVCGIRGLQRENCFQKLGKIAFLRVAILCYNQLMQVELTKPKLQKFIDDQVQAGHFPSAQAAIETAVEQMMLDHGVLDDSTLAVIAKADAEYERGDFVEWRDVRDDLRKKYLGE